GESFRLFTGQELEDGDGEHFLRHGESRILRMPRLNRLRRNAPRITNAAALKPRVILYFTQRRNLGLPRRGSRWWFSRRLQSPSPKPKEARKPRQFNVFVKPCAKIS